MTLLATAAAASDGRSQQPLPLVSADVRLSDYGIAGPEDVMRGRVSIAYAPDGPRLGIYYLRDTPPPPRRPPTPPAAETSPSPPSGHNGSAGRLERALWVWTTADIVADTDERRTFLEFIARQGITHVFLYIPAAEGERAAAGFIPFDGAELGPLLADLRERGAVAYALDGDRDYVLPENHAGVYRTVERVVAHNRAVPPEQRFHGVRYDIEPYLAAGFQGPARQSLLDGYVEVIAGVAERARAGGLAVAVDVPFWFDAPDEETGEYMVAEHGGERRPVLEHVMSLVDDMAIMDYRTAAEGPNGALVHATGELALGAEAGVGVYVGVETTRLLDEDLHTFSGPPVEGLPVRANARWVVIEGLDAGRARVWLVDGEAALRQLRSRVDLDRGVRHWPAGRPARVAADAQSFHNLGRESMERVTAQLVEHFSASRAFRGLAFHDYRGLRDLLEGR